MPPCGRRNGATSRLSGPAVPDGRSSRAVGRIEIGGHDHRVTVDVDAEGVLRSVGMPRWGDPAHESFGEYPFGAVFQGEAAFGDYTIASAARVGWWFGTERWDEGEFFRYTIDSASFC